MSKTKKSTKATAQTEIITEADLVEVETLRAQKKQAAATVKAAEIALDVLETALIKKLEAGAAIEGNLSAVIKQELGRCSPKWKELYVEEQRDIHGISEAETVAAAQTLFPATKKNVLVIGPANPVIR